MIKLKNIAFLSVSLFILSCSVESTKEIVKEERNYLQIEKDSLESHINSSSLNSYKSIKNLARTFSGEISESKIISNDTYQLIAKYASKILKGEDLSIGESLNDAPKLLSLKSDFNKVQSIYSNTNEDEQEPLMVGISYLTGYEMPDNWTADHEHFILSLLLRQTSYDIDMMLYETSRINPSNMKQDEIALLASLYKGVVLMENGYEHIAEQEFNASLKAIENEGFIYTGLLDYTVASASENEGLNKKNQLLTLTKILRATARTSMESDAKRKAGIEDMGALLAEFSSSGEINELNILAEALLMSTKGNNEDGISKLQKLSAENILSFSEQLKLNSKIEDLRNNSVHTHSVIQKSLIGGFVAKKLFEYIQTTDYYKNLKLNEAGNSFLNLFDNIEKYKGYYESIKPLLNIY